MNKTEMIRKVAKRQNISIAQAKRTVEEFFNIMEEELTSGSTVKISGLGSFKFKIRKARDARNPHTGDLIHVPEKKVLTFKLSKSLKDKCSNMIW